MNKIVYAAPLLAALSLSNAASAVGYQFSVPTFFTQIQGIAQNFTSLEGAVSNLSTDAGEDYTSSTTDTSNPNSYASQAGLYASVFNYCLPESGPSPCTSAEVNAAMDGQEQLKTANSTLSALPNATQVEGSLSALNTGIGQLDASDVTSLQNQLGTINSALTTAQGYAQQILNNNAGAAAKAQQAAAAMKAKAPAATKR